MRHRLSPRETVVVVIFGTTTAEGAPPSVGAVDMAVAGCGSCEAAMSSPLDDVACAGANAVTTVSGTLNGTSARARTAPEFDSTSSSLTR